MRSLRLCGNLLNKNACGYESQIKIFGVMDSNGFCPMSEMSEYQLGRPACNGAWYPHPFQVYAVRSCNKAGKMLGMRIIKLAAIVRYVSEGV